MRTIALVTQKGGSGKSTLAACLAVAAQEAGERVFLVDMDPQKSLVKWGRRRTDKDLAVEAVTALKLPAAMEALAKSNVTLVIIDTPATDSPSAEAAMRAADFSIIPARPTIFDIWSSEVTRGKLKTLGRDFAFVLNQCPAVQESQRVQDGAAALETMGALLRPLIASRVVLPGSRPRRPRRDRTRIGRQGGGRDAPALGCAEAPSRQEQGRRARPAQGGLISRRAPC